MLDHFERSFPSKSTTASDGGLPAASCVLGVAGVTTGGRGRARSWSSQLGSGWPKHRLLLPSRAQAASSLIAPIVKMDFLEFIGRRIGRSIVRTGAGYQRRGSEEKNCLRPLICLSNTGPCILEDRSAVG